VNHLAFTCVHRHVVNGIRATASPEEHKVAGHEQIESIGRNERPDAVLLPAGSR
jgi:hypothetical protein